MAEPTTPPDATATTNDQAAQGDGGGVAVLDPPASPHTPPLERMTPQEIAQAEATTPPAHMGMVDASEYRKTWEITSPVKNAEGLTNMAGTSAVYWCDDEGKVRAVDVDIWRNLPGGEVGQHWKAKIRWDALGGAFMLSYPNPSGGPDYHVPGRQQHAPLVDHAIKLGSETVLSGLTP